MAYVFRSTQVEPRARGEEFGSVHADRINDSIASYSYIYSELIGRKFDFAKDFLSFGLEALAATRRQAPALCEEMIGIAEGAGIEPAIIGALNARTEILARLRVSYPGECSAVAHIDPAGTEPLALQNWDWFEPAADNWLVWEIPHRDGSMTTTFTEFGMLGKIGINSHGVGALFTILRHANDGANIGFPVHVAARWALDTGKNITTAMRSLALVKVSASSSITLVSNEANSRTAVGFELYPRGPGIVFPNDKGLLVRTNHFLTAEAEKGDKQPSAFPDTFLRRDILMRRLAPINHPTVDDVLAVMCNRIGGEYAICAIPTADQKQPCRKTAATVILDFERHTLRVIEGGYRGASLVNDAAD
jgi:isopenicillin-N N-acyltransferase-like protein